jgi:hypothetical protein
MTGILARKTETLKVYVAGKVSPNSVFGTQNWRDGFCHELSRKSGFQIFNLDPTKVPKGFKLNENDSKLIFGRDCFMIKSSDLVIVYLTNDISVGGSQEMLIAKYYNKPLIGIAPSEGKFNRQEKEISGIIYKNWIHPFVNMPCDSVVESINEAAEFVKEFFANPSPKVKGLSVVDEALAYYKDNYYDVDEVLRID